MKSIFSLLIFLFNAMSVQSIQASEALSLQATFNGERPFFGIAVTRDVANNPDDYAPLSGEENYFIFCLLNSLYGNEVNEGEFIAEIERIQAEKARRFLALKQEESRRLNEATLREIDGKALTNDFLSKMIPRLNKVTLFKTTFTLEEKHMPVLQQIVVIMLQADNSIKLFEEVDKMLEGRGLEDESLRAEAMAVYDKLNFLHASSKKVAQAKKILEEVLTIKNSLRTLVEESFAENERFLLTRVAFKDLAEGFVAERVYHL